MAQEINNGNQELKNKTLLVVHTGTIKKKFIFQKLKKLGLRVVVLNKEKDWADPYVDHWIIADVNNYKECLENIKTFLASNRHIKIDGVITFWEESVILVSRISEKFNLIGIPYSIAKKARNKFLFREFCKANNLPYPKHIIIRKKDDLTLVDNKLDYPLVLKPIYGSSSAFVIKVKDKEELWETYDYIKNNISTHPDSAEWEELTLMAEEYIDGDEVDIDILVQNGKLKYYSITDNYKTKEPFFIETGFSIPSSLPEKEQLDLFEMAEETLEKLSVQNGLIHFEAKSTKNGPISIEVNLRMGGDEVYSFVKGAWGVDLIENAVKIALGIYIKIKKPVIPFKYFAGQDFLSNDSGIIAQINVDEKIKNNKYLEEIHFFKNIGDPLLVPPEGYEYLGWITVSGDNLIDAQNNLEEILKYVDYKVIKFDPDSTFGRTSRKNHFSAAVLKKDILIRQAKLEHIKLVGKKGFRNLHLGVIYNNYQHTNNNLEKDLTETGKNIIKALSKKGYKVLGFDLNNLPKALNELKKSDVDLIINACDRIHNSSLLKAHAPALLETLQIPYAGSSPSTISLCIDKISVKKILTYHNIPTPVWDYAYSIDDEIDDELQYPLIVKPSNADNSIGITNKSIVYNKRQLKQQIKKITVNMKKPALIEEYIEGDEYDVAILGSEDYDLRVLPLARSIFKNLPKKYPHIYTYDAKWSDNPIYERIIVQRPPKKINKKLESLITEIALDTYNILDCHDYGRVEIRVDEDNNPYVLELNPNPSINSNTFITEAAKLIDMNYENFLEEIIAMAVKRYKNNKNGFQDR